MYSIVGKSISVHGRAIETRAELQNNPEWSNSGGFPDGAKIGIVPTHLI